MTSIYDIPYEDIATFLLANNINTNNFKDENEVYNIVRNLFKDKNAKGHTTSIIEWMIAYNLLITKVNIPNYTVYEIDKMSQNEIDQLAKLLTLEGNNVENIKNILRYLHKLDETVNIGGGGDLTVAGEAIYNIILGNMSNKTINRMNINKYTKLSLDDQKFWRDRLYNIFNLKTNVKNFDYRFAVKFLDNGKSFEENYHEAMNKGLKPIIKLLLDNGVVDEVKPDVFLDNISTTLPDLGEMKILPYSDFIEKIMNQTNEINEDQQIDISFFDKIEYTGKEFKVILDIEVLDMKDLSGENVEELTKATFISDGGITNGEILYKIAQLIPNDEEIRKMHIKYINDNSELILKEIEQNRISYKSRINNKNKNDDQNLTKEFLRDLIKSPEAFLNFLDRNYENEMNSMLQLETSEPYHEFLPYYSNFFGDHIFWEGLNNWGGEKEYRVRLGSQN